MYKLLSKIDGAVHELMAREDSLLLEQHYQAYLQFASEQDWKITTLNNGKVQLRRGKEVQQIWIQSPEGEVVR